MAVTNETRACLFRRFGMRLNRMGMIRMIAIQNKYKKNRHFESGMRAFSFCSTHLKNQKHVNDMVYPSNDSGMRTSNYNICPSEYAHFKMVPTKKTLLNNAKEKRKTRANHEVNQLTYDTTF